MRHYEKILRRNINYYLPIAKHVANIYKIHKECKIQIPADDETKSFNSTHQTSVSYNKNNSNKIYKRNQHPPIYIQIS